jgi:hypothetical protein
MARTQFVNAPFGDWRNPTSPRSATELSFTKNFDIKKPAVMVFFAHGHKATLERDVEGRQRVLEQLEKAGLNAVLVAPQLAYNKASSDAGRFGEPDFAKKFFDEAAMKLAQRHDKQNPPQDGQKTLDTFRNMPIILVSYSGGYGATNAIVAQSMRDPPRVPGAPYAQNAPRTLKERIAGAVYMDSMYAGAEVLKQFASQPHHPFLISNYLPGKRDLTRANSQELESHFRQQGRLSRGVVDNRQNVHIYQANGRHWSLVENGLAQALGYVPGYRTPGDPPLRIAARAPMPNERGRPARPEAH